ncbi:MAG: hypothetical protein ACON5N_07350 [Akkermansiaceae bacterium]
MNNPYESPKSKPDRLPPGRSGRRFLKHFCCYGLLVVLANSERITGLLTKTESSPPFSVTSSILGVLFFYLIGYFGFARVRGGRKR